MHRDCYSWEGSQKKRISRAISSGGIEYDYCPGPASQVSPTPFQSIARLRLGLQPELSGPYRGARGEKESPGEGGWWNELCLNAFL